MLWEQQEAYASSSESSCPSFGDSNSLSSFYSQATCDGSELRTPPPCTRRASLDSAKFDNMTFPEVHTPERHGIPDELASMSSMHGDGTGFVGQNMLFHDNMMRDQAMLPLGYQAVDDFESFRSNNGLPICTPSLDMDLSSPVSCMESYPVTMSFVNPSQTTFNTFDINSPRRPLHFQSPTSDCTADLSFDLSPTANLNYQLRQFEECPSTLATPSRSSVGSYRNSTARQPLCGPVRSSAALQRAQAEPLQAARRSRKQLQRKFDAGFIPNDIAIQPCHKAGHFCTWPNCDRKFKRGEHLKRHERIHTAGDSYMCNFCPKPRSFNRFDNLKAHVQRHSDPHQTKRTNYHPDARATWEAMDQKKKNKIKSEIKPESVSAVKRERLGYPTKSRGLRSDTY